MIKSQTIFSPQNYLLAMTGHCYILHDDFDVVKSIHLLLQKHGVEDENRKIADFPFTDVRQVVESNLNVVLVDISGYGPDDEWKTQYRWFEVTDEFNEEV